MKKTLLITAVLSLMGIGAYALIKQTDAIKQKGSTRRQKRDNTQENSALSGHGNHNRKPNRNNNRDTANRKKTDSLHHHQPQKNSTEK